MNSPIVVLKRFPFKLFNSLYIQSAFPVSSLIICKSSSSTQPPLPSVIPIVCVAIPSFCSHGVVGIVGVGLSFYEPPPARIGLGASAII